jgi:hypothetical protein
MTTFAEACKTAEDANDPILAMLKDADERLGRIEPDIVGARVALQGARLVVALRLLEPAR